MQKNVAFLTASELAFDLGTGLITIFGIIFFYNITNHSLIMAAIPFALLHLIHAFLLPRLSKLLTILDLKKSMALALFFYISGNVTVYFLTNQTIWPVFISWAFLTALGNIFHYAPAIYVLGKNTDHQTRGRIFGIRKAFFIINTIILPLVGGLTSQVFGLKGLTILCTALYAVSILPIIKIENINIPKPVALKDLIKTKLGSKIATLKIGQMISDDLSNFWPIFVFLILKDGYTEVGTLFTLTGFVTVILSYTIGVLIDHTKRIKLFEKSSILDSIAWIVRIFSFNYWSVFITDTIYKLTYTFKGSVIDVIDYDLMNKLPESEEHRFGLIILSETVFNYAIAAGFIIFAVLISALGFQGAFVAVSIFGLIATQVTKKVLNKTD